MDKWKVMGIPGFKVIGPVQTGILDQYYTVGWKWESPVGLLGQATMISALLADQIRIEPSYVVDHALRKQMPWVVKWNRRWTSDACHLWIAAWRLQNKVKSLEQTLEKVRIERSAYFIDTRNCSRFQRWILKTFFGHTYLSTPKWGPVFPMRPERTAEEDDD